ncbi:MAG: ATP-binding protein, partial [Bacteroidales bacterium]
LLRFSYRHSSLQLAITGLLVSAITCWVGAIYLNTLNYTVFFVIFGLLLIFTLQKYYFGSLISARCLALNLVLFAGLLTILLQYHNQEKEQKERRVAAVKAAAKQDPVAETMFLEIEEQVQKDDTLGAILSQQPLDEDLVISYVLYKYFDDYWSKYNFQATLCFPFDSLIIRSEAPKQNCKEFFEGMINERGHFTYSNNLYYMDNNPWFSSYIARLHFPRWPEQDMPPVTLYLEMDAKFAPEGLVYPELLIDETIDRSDLFTGEYNVAKYVNNDLVASIGSYNFYINAAEYQISKTRGSYFFDHDGYNHLYYPVSETETLIVSRHIPGTGETLAPFAYVLIFLALFLLLLAILLNPGMFRQLRKNFKTRLQFAFFIVVLTSFFFIGFLSIFYLQNLNEDKNSRLLKEKSHSILIETEDQLSEHARLDPDMRPYINDLLYNLSSVFFTDINMYNDRGKLIATSRPEIYEAGLVSKNINSQILEKLRQKGQTIILHDEAIGNLGYSSAYMPFRNNRNEVIAYLNVPYYAKQSELENEITGFLATFINLYVILLAISIAFGLLVTSYITRPLNLIKSQMRKVKLGASNEKINWVDQDEIGELIQEYNKMIDELERSADLLMRSQRESAWREMARQVAHEIKNPLTPMKLNIQLLQRSSGSQSIIQDNKKLKRITDSLLEQIDNLASIASEFSNFARMPAPKPTLIQLEEAVKHSCDLYNNYENVSISFVNYARNTLVKADYKQLIRAFNNILDNAVQSIPKRQAGKIEVSINPYNDHLLVTIRDNGKGIPVEMQSKIFSPSFTTKSAGMGLGLTIVKSIITNAGGKVWYESVENEGTTFFVEMPVIKE